MKKSITTPYLNKMNTLTRIDYITDQKEQFGLILQKIDTVRGGELQVPMYKISTIGTIHEKSFVNTDLDKLFEELKDYLKNRVTLKQFLEIKPIEEVELKALIMGLLS